jgi:hypothetical protein
MDTERVRARLLSGHDFAFLDGAEEWPALSRDELREAWTLLRDELLQEHIAQQPGSRPWAWWQWEAPEDMRQIGEDRTKLSCGRVYVSPIYETEAAYLARLNLLTAAERMVLKGD